MKLYIKWKTEQSAKKWIQSKKCSEYLNFVKLKIRKLKRKSLREKEEPFNHGNMMITPSLYEASCLESEIKRILRLIDYFNEKGPKPGWKLEYKNSNVEETIDLSNPTINHPEFLKWVGKHKVDKDELPSLLNVWVETYKPKKALGSVSSLFKRAFYFTARELHNI